MNENHQRLSHKLKLGKLDRGCAITENHPLPIDGSISSNHIFPFGRVLGGLKLFFESFFSLSLSVESFPACVRQQ